MLMPNELCLLTVQTADERTRIVTSHKLQRTSATGTE